ncbi:MAG: hypothetical protein JWN41_169 [Thermoleophilia bacterium]|nr:hypothetical protein [Thermoleophilia bacterium]
MREMELVLVQRRRIRRIWSAFAVIVVLLPLVALGGAWAFVLVPLLLVALLAMREARALRRTPR